MSALRAPRSVRAARSLRAPRSVRAVYHLARADFLERVRRSSFLILVGLTVYTGYLFVPPVDAAYQTVALGDSRGVYNSAWMGAMYGLMISTLITLIAFYPIKNTVARDRETRVGQIIAATPLRKAGYALGKWLSNLALLTVLLVVMTAMAAVMQWVRAEEMRLDLAALAVPLWLIAFPPLALVAALAVLFECTPVLRGAAGNVAYFFLFMAVLTAWLVGADGIVMERVNDPFGISFVIADMQRTVIPLNPEYDGQVTIGGSALSADPLIFRWEGMAWTGAMIGARLSWVGVAALLALAAALPFDRFDPARSTLRHRKRQVPDATALLSEGEPQPPPQPSPATAPPGAAEGGESLWSLQGAGIASSPPSTRLRGGLVRVLLAELRLALKGRRWWWFAVLAGLNVAALAVPDVLPNAGGPPLSGATVRGYLLAAAWFWPIAVWSAMGCRARQHNTRPIVFSVPRPVGRPLAAAWLAGLCVTAVAGSGYALRLVFAGQGPALAAWAAGALLIPSLALALGVWTGSRRAFEVVYTFLWYLGPVNQVTALDYVGVTAGALAGRFWRYHLLAGVLLLALAALGRTRQVRQL